MRSPRIHKLSMLLAAGLAAGGLAACGTGSAATTSSSTSTGSAPELSNITIDLRAAADSAPVWIAEQDGYFKQQGLNVTVNFAPGTSAEFTGMAAHTVDFAQVDYISGISEEHKNPQFGLRFVVDDTQSAPDTSAIMVPSNSGITSLAQLKGKVIAFPSPGVAFGELALDEQLKGYDLGPKNYTEDTLGYPDMAEPLERGEIAAAFSIQPYITELESEVGAHELVDLVSGPMTNFPTLGWATTAAFAAKYPKTVAAFQRAVEKGQQVAASNTPLVRQLMIKYIPSMSAKIANVIPLETFNTALSVTRVQRVATVMEQFGALPANFDVSQMIIPLPSGA
jgi:NitT/TauT family transport system substrate-binding protein